MDKTQFDAGTGTLSLTPSAIVALAQATRGLDPLSVEARAELSSGGLLESGGLHRRLMPVAETIGRSLVRLRLDDLLSRGSGCEGWIDASLAVLVESNHPQRVAGNVVVAPRAFVPATLARAVHLGPRTRSKVGEPLELDAGLLEALLTAGGALDADQIAGLLDPGEPVWLETLAALSRGIRGRWRAGVWWNSSTEQPSARLIEIVDSDSGLFLVTTRPRGAMGTRRIELRPVSSRQVWRLLCALVPPADQVTEPLVP